MLFSCQAAAQLLSVGMIIHAHTTCSTPVSSLLVQPWFVVLVIAGAIERLSGLALGVAMERDWVVLVLLTLFVCLNSHLQYGATLNSSIKVFEIFLDWNI